MNTPKKVSLLRVNGLNFVFSIDEISKEVLFRAWVNLTDSPFPLEVESVHASIHDAVKAIVAHCELLKVMHATNERRKGLAPLRNPYAVAAAMQKELCEREIVEVARSLAGVNTQSDTAQEMYDRLAEMTPLVWKA